MAIREAIVAGRFYEDSDQQCRSHLEQLLAEGAYKGQLPESIVAAVVPHAGWVFSGDLAGMAFKAVKQCRAVDTFVIYGAVHSARTNCGMLYDKGQWITPLGSIDVDETLAQQILCEAGDLVRCDCSGHSREHSIEVQVPFIQYLFPDAKIVPLMVPPFIKADQIGQAVARAIQHTDKQVVGIASTDLTHYGPSYGFTPQGCGPDAISWAKESNDQFFINLALTMQADKLVESAQLYGSACGSGAVAAAVGQSLEQGVEKGLLLAHTTSAEVMKRQYQQASEDSVGYAAIVFG